MRGPYDLAIVGAGILGLANALAAVRMGKRVVVIERNAAAIGASIRNFGFVTVTGQQRGTHWRRAMRSRDVWLEIGPQAGIDVLHRGLVLLARRPEAAAVLEAFLATEMGAGCRMIGAETARGIVPALRTDGAAAILHSPHEARVESREAIPRLARWLAAEKGVTFLWSTDVHEVTPPRIVTSRGVVEAGAAVVCPGDNYGGPFAEVLSAAGLAICTLQMLRVMPAAPSPLGAAVMSDLSLVRYDGYAVLPEAAALRAAIEAEQAEDLAAGVHLIAVQSADGSLVVGDSHVYAATAAPFAQEAVDALILAELDRVLALPGRRVTERWTGSYAAQAEGVIFFDRPDKDVRLLVVTGGTGASTAFALGEEVIEDLYGTEHLPREASA